MVKILFVCHGNICRSPMAEFVMKDLAAKAGAGQHDFTSSPRPPAPRKSATRSTLRRGAKLAAHGISCLRGACGAAADPGRDYDAYDLLIGMDSANLRDMHPPLRRRPGRQEVHRLLDHAPPAPATWPTPGTPAISRPPGGTCTGRLHGASGNAGNADQ